MAKDNIQPSVLIVEDDESIIALLEYNLEKEGFRVRITKDGEEALIMVDENKPDIILLDWMLPGLSGVQICKDLRSKDATKSIPIIMISAKGEESDRIEGLDSGVDDYLVKPFSPKELIARINAVFRRIRPSFVAKNLEYGDIKMDLVSKRVYYRGNEHNLGPVEYRILQALLEHPKRVLSRDQLIRRVWGCSLHVETRTIDVHINRLRKALKIEKAGTVIKTVRSAGYCLKNPEDLDVDVLSVPDGAVGTLEELGEEEF